MEKGIYNYSKAVLGSNKDLVYKMDRGKARSVRGGEQSALV